MRLGKIQVVSAEIGVDDEGDDWCHTLPRCGCKAGTTPRLATRGSFRLGMGFPGALVLDVASAFQELPDVTSRIAQEQDLCRTRL